MNLALRQLDADNSSHARSRSATDIGESAIRNDMINGMSATPLQVITLVGTLTPYVGDTQLGLTETSKPSMRSGRNQMSWSRLTNRTSCPWVSTFTDGSKCKR